MNVYLLNIVVVLILIAGWVGFAWLAYLFGRKVHARLNGNDGLHEALWPLKWQAIGLLAFLLIWGYVTSVATIIQPKHRLAEPVKSVQEEQVLAPVPPAKSEHKINVEEASKKNAEENQAAKDRFKELD